MQDSTVFQLYPASVVVGENRQRREFNADQLHELTESIKKLGLMHPIVLRDSESKILVAGERRLRACQILLKMGHTIKHAGQEFTGVPCTTMGALSPIEFEEAELEENIIRVDLSWQDKARAIDRLHQLKLQQNPAHTQTETARQILGDDASSAEGTRLVRDSHIIMQHMNDPAVAKAKNQAEAMKVIRKKVTKEARNDIAKLIKTDTSDHRLLLGDSRQLLLGVDSASADCILTDPPYGIGADNFGDQAQTTHDYQDSEAYFLNLMGVLAKESFRIAKPKAHLYMFMDLRYWQDMKELFTLAGWNVWPNPMIWSKGNGMLPRPSHGPRRTYEAILFANKGDREVTGVYPDVINVAPVADKRHGAEKPVALYTNLLQRSCLAGDTVIDPFAGSGTIFPAANALQLKAIGMNLSEDDYNLAKTRLNEGLGGLELSF